METGKPDEVGKVGENAVGPLSLPRPEGKPLGYLTNLAPFLCFVIYSLISAVALVEWAPEFSLRTGRSESEAELALRLGLELLLGVYPHRYGSLQNGKRI